MAAEGRAPLTVAKSSLIRLNWRFLPAAPATATTAAASTVTAAISASASAVSSAAAAVLCLGPRLVDIKRAPPHLRAVQGRDGLLSVFVAGHFHKAEPARAPGIAVRHDADPVHLPKGLEHLA